MLSREHLRIPRNWEIIAGADTGTYMGGAICAIDPNYELYVLEEFPNYRYTGDGTIELTGETVGDWIRRFGSRLQHYTKQRRGNFAWADFNTPFKTEVGQGFKFKGNKKPLELRTEITREYLRNGRLHLMPWLETIPYEMEEAHYPEKESAGTGAFKRAKLKDHCLDGVEHCASRRPHPDFTESAEAKKTGIHAIIAQNMRLETRGSDPHLGAQ